MLLILLAVFLTVFALIVLVAIATSGRSSSEDSLRATLDSVLLRTSSPASEEIVDLRKKAALSAIPWMDRLLARIRAAAQLRRVLDQADLPWTPGVVFFTALGLWLVAIYFIQLKTGVLSLSALLALPATAAPFFYVLKKREWRFQRFQEKLPDAIDLMVSALRAGNSTMGALGIAAREAPE